MGLVEDLHTFIERPGDAAGRDELGRRLFENQCEAIPEYGRFARGHSVRFLHDIPSVPEIVYKGGGPRREGRSVKTFRSSGTSGANRTEIELSETGLSLMETAITSAARRHLFPDSVRPAVLLLIPSPRHAPDVIMVHGMDLIGRRFGAKPPRSFVTGGQIDFEGLTRALEEEAAEGCPVFLAGGSFAVVHFLEFCRERGWSLELPEGSRTLDAGGFKGRSRSIHPGSLRAMVRECLGVPEGKQINLLGMTELASQIYDSDERREANEDHDGFRVKQNDPWTATTVIDPRSGAATTGSGCSSTSIWRSGTGRARCSLPIWANPSAMEASSSSAEPPRSPTAVAPHLRNPGERLNATARKGRAMTTEILEATAPTAVELTDLNQLEDPSHALEEGCRRLVEEGRPILSRYSVTEIAEAVGTVCAEWRNPSHPERCRVVAKVIEDTGMSRQIVEQGLDVELENYATPCLLKALESEFGDPRYLDGFQANAATGGRSRAHGPRLIVHWFSSTIPALPALGMVRGLLLKSPGVGRISSRETAFAPAFLGALSRVLPGVERAVWLTTWAPDLPGCLDVIARTCDAAIVYGSEQTCATMRKRLAPHLRFVEHGHRVGITLIDRGAVAPDELPALSEACALDVATF